MPLWTVSEVALYLNVTERTIYRLLTDKQIPAYKVGGQWRFKEDEIMAWLTSKQPVPGKRKS